MNMRDTPRRVKLIAITIHRGVDRTDAAATRIDTVPARRPPGAGRDIGG